MSDLRRPASRASDDVGRYRYVRRMTVPTRSEVVRTAYDAIAARYAAQFRTALDALPVDRALIAAFAELVRASGAGPIADVGCGPGLVTAHLHALGTTAFGVDLSPAMVALARESYPDLRFEEGSMTALKVPDRGLGGVLAWYSIIHMPPEEVPAVFAEFARVTAPDGHLLLAFFQADDHAGDRIPAFDHKVTTAYRWPIDRLAALARDAGFAEIARLTREPADGERFPRGHLLARRSLR